MELRKPVVVFAEVVVTLVKELIFEFPAAVGLINNVELQCFDGTGQNIALRNEGLTAIEYGRADVLQCH